MIKNIELKRQNEINDIKAFRSLIQKCFDVMDINENNFYSNYTPSKSNKNKLTNGELSQDEENNRIKHKKLKKPKPLITSSKDKKYLLNQIRNVAIDVLGGYSLVFKKQMVKKDVINPSEIPSEKPFGNENLNEGEEKIKNADDNYNVEYKLVELNDSKEMQIDDGNGIAIDKKEINSIQNTYESIMSGLEHKIIICELSDEKLQEKESNKIVEIQESKENAEFIDYPNDNSSNSFSVKLNEKEEKSENKEEENQTKLDHGIEGESVEQAELNHVNGDLEVKSKISDSNDKIDKIISEDENNEINNLDANEEMKIDENYEQINQENLNNIFSESQYPGLENKNDFEKIIENASIKIKDKRHAKEYTYKLQNYRNIYGKTVIINYHPLSYNDSLNPYLFPWYYIKCRNMKPYDIMNQYKGWIKDEDTYNKEILKLPIIQSNRVNQESNIANKKGKKKKLGSRSNNLSINNKFVSSNFSNVFDNLVNKEIPIAYVASDSAVNEILYCYCKNPNSTDIMTGN